MITFIAALYEWARWHKILRQSREALYDNTNEPITMKLMYQLLSSMNDSMYIIITMIETKLIQIDSVNISITVLVKVLEI